MARRKKKVTACLLDRYSKYMLLVYLMATFMYTGKTITIYVYTRLISPQVDAGQDRGLNLKYSVIQHHNWRKFSKGTAIFPSASSAWSKMTR